MSVESTGTFVRYQNSATDESLADSLLLSVAIGGGPPRLLLMDTGSTGMVVSQELIGTDFQVMEPQPDWTPGYSSSGRSNYQGQWVTAPVEVWSAGTRAFTTQQPIPVFAVQNHKGVSMMGIGVLWQLNGVKAAEFQAMQSFNAFLNLPEIGGCRYRRGYIVTRDGVQFGYDEAVIGQFATAPFQVAEGSQPPRPGAVVTLTPVAGSGLAPYSASVPLLVDTGISYVILTPPGEITQPDPGYAQPVASTRPGEQTAFKPGVQVTVTMQAASGPLTLYDFDAGECGVYGNTAGPGTPWLARFGPLGTSSPGVLNTGVHILAAYDFLVDVDSGVMGFRARQET